MHAKWSAYICAMAFALGVTAAAQNSGSSEAQDTPVLKTRPKDGASPSEPQGQVVYQPASAPASPPNALPEGTRFIVSLKDTLDTHDLQQGQHFEAELREDLVTPSGLTVSKGHK